MKNILKILAVLTLASIAMFGGSAKAQAPIRNLHDYSSFSLIREIDADSQLCYNYRDRGRFYRVGDPSTMCSIMFIDDPNVIINDFEILNDTVYFCGRYYGKAIVGYFDLFAYPNSQVWYFFVDDVYSLNKLDVYDENNEIRIEMVAQIRSPFCRDNYTIVEARKTLGTWGYSVMNTPKGVFSFDDVAVTKNKVMFTGRGVDDKDSTLAVSTELWVFKKPSSGYSLFSNPAEMRIIDYKPTSLVLIEHSVEDTAAIVSNIYGDMAVSSLFDATSYIGSCSFMPDAASSYVKDIKYSVDSMNFNILTGGHREEAFNGTIYTVSIPRYTYSGMVSYREIPDHEVQSLTYIYANPFNFAASGHDNTSTLHVYRFNQLYPANCIPITGDQSDALEYVITDKETNEVEKSNTAELIRLDTFSGTLDIETICEEEE